MIIKEISLWGLEITIFNHWLRGVIIHAPKLTHAFSRYYLYVCDESSVSVVYCVPFMEIKYKTGKFHP